MRNLNALLIITTLLVAACGNKKNPVGEDLTTIRTEGKKINEMGPQKPVTITNTRVVEKPVKVIHEESTIDDKFLTISPDPQMSFNEGQKSSYQIRSRILVPGAKVKLTAVGLPDGATLTPAGNEEGLYHISWTPDFYTIPTTANMKTYTVKLVAQVASTTKPEDLAKLKHLVREQEISIFLFRNQELPKDLKISNLPTEILAGSEPKVFSITVKVPGMDNRSPEKPRLVISYDGVSYTPGQNFLELDGSRYVIVDPNNRGPEYLGDYNWRFSRVFDTRNIPVQPQLTKDGSLMTNADGTRVRLSFKVYGSLGLSTPDSLFQMKIRYESKEARK